MDKAKMDNDGSDIDFPNAKLAYTIIQSLLAHNEAVSDLMVAMAHALDQDVTKALTLTNEWEKYLESKRNLENTKAQIETFTEELRKMDAATR